MADFITNCGFIPTAGGTTDWTYSSAVGGYQSPSAAQAVNGATYVLRAQSSDLTQWEYSVGTYNSSTGVFARTTVLYNSSGSGTKQGGAGTKINFSVAPALIVVVAIAEELVPAQAATPRGRLTLTSGTPITTADVTAATTVYYTPFDGNIISLYDGAIWVPLKFAETSLSLSGLTANTNYDVWGRISSGALALDTTAWTNDTTRATAIAQQDGIDIKSGDTTRRLLGTVRITGTTGQTEDSRAKRFVSNRYNDVSRPMVVNDPAATGPQAVGTSYRQANSNSANQLDYVCCVPRLVQATIYGEMVYVPGGSVTAGNGTSQVAIGIDTVPASSQSTLQTPANVNTLNSGFPTFAYYAGTPGVGRHTILWCEYVQAANISAGSGTITPTWIYTNPPGYICGIAGTVSG